MKLIGHAKTKKLLSIAAKAAYRDNRAMPHALFSGSPGCGKTTLAREIARHFKLPFLSVVPTDFKDYKTTIKVLEQLDHTGYDDGGNRIGQTAPTLLFVDEVHNIPLKGQEALGLVMERFIIESGRPNKFIWIPYFTLIGATTLAGNLSKPFLDRFKLNFTFETYGIDEMMRIVKFHAIRLGVATSKEGMHAVAKRSRGTPRVAVSYLENIRDRMRSMAQKWAPVSMIEEVFSDLCIDKEGLTKTEIKILKALLEAGLPVSLDNLSIITGESAKTIKGYSEPFLIKKKLIMTTGRGRVLTHKGEEYARNIGTDKFVKKEIDFNTVRR